MTNMQIRKVQAMLDFCKQSDDFSFGFTKQDVEKLQNELDLAMAEDIDEDNIHPEVRLLNEISLNILLEDVLVYNFNSNLNNVDHILHELHNRELYEITVKDISTTIAAYKQLHDI